MDCSHRNICYNLNTRKRLIANRYGLKQGLNWLHEQVESKEFLIHANDQVIDGSSKGLFVLSVQEETEASSLPEEQECFLRTLLAYQIPSEVEFYPQIAFLMERGPTLKVRRG